MFYRISLVISIVLLGFSSTVPASLAQSNSPDDRVVRISPPNQSYIDPEVLPGGNVMTYQTQNTVYLAELDPATGMFVTPDGKDILVDTDAAPGLETFNGPEFGIDANGWALFYAKSDQGSIQIWRADLDANGTPQTARLTSGSRHQTQLVSRNPAAPTTRIAAIEGTWQDGTAVWFDEADPTQIHEIAPIENGIASLRWVDNSFLLTYSQRVGADQGQVVLFDTETNTERTITSDAGDKTDPYGWYAPDFGGELLVLAIVDNAAVAVYRDTGGDHWERIMTLYPPAESRHDFVSSAEPFVLAGKSYMSLVVKEAGSNRERFADSEVWLFDLGSDDSRYAERCDSGEIGIARSDPEVYIGDQNVFVYYNVLGGAGVSVPYEARRCRSELTVSAAVTTTGPERLPVSPQVGAEVCQWIEPQATDGQITTALEPHYVCRDTAISPKNKLLVFFPGTAAVPADYEWFVQEGAAMGLHAIGLTYPNERSANLEICPEEPDANCLEQVRREVILGEDLHPEVAIDAANSITNRIVRLLQYLDQQYPDAGWGQYLNGDTPRWENIVVAGHSQGAGMAAYIAHLNPVARAVLFSWVDLWRGIVAPWILEPNATPGENIYIFEHLEDRARGANAKADMRAAFGVDVLGEADVDSSTPPYGNAHVLTTTIEPIKQGPRVSSGAHNVVVVDDYTPLVDGIPALRDVWRYLLDVQE